MIAAPGEGGQVPAEGSLQVCTMSMEEQGASSGATLGSMCHPCEYALKAFAALVLLVHCPRR